MIESTAILEEGCMVDVSCYIGHYTIIRPKAYIGLKSEIRAHCFIAEGAQIGINTHVFQYSNIGAYTIIENDVWIGPRVLICNTKNIAHCRPYDTKISPSIIRQGARIASGVVILPDVEIGKNALVGAGSVVTKNVPPNTIVYGNPAKVTGIVPLKERI